MVTLGTTELSNPILLTINPDASLEKSFLFIIAFLLTLLGPSVTSTSAALNLPFKDKSPLIIALPAAVMLPEVTIFFPTVTLPCRTSTSFFKNDLAITLRSLLTCILDW